MSYRLIAPLVAVLAIAACSDSEDAEIETTDTSELTTPSEVADSEQGSAAQANALTCTDPVRAEDTADSLRERFGSDARVVTLAGAEGMGIPGVVLWEGDPTRALEVGFTEESRDQVAFVRAREASRWSVAGLQVGDQIDRVVEANGVPIGFYGFGWDYGGTVYDFYEGSLGRFGECGVMITLELDETITDPPLQLMGDHTLSSDTPQLPLGGVQVSEIGLAF